MTTNGNAKITSWFIDVFIGGHVPPFTVGEGRKEISSIARPSFRGDRGSIRICFAVSPTGNVCNDIATDAAASFDNPGTWVGPDLVEELSSKSIPFTPFLFTLMLLAIVAVAGCCKIGEHHEP